MKFIFMEWKPDWYCRNWYCTVTNFLSHILDHRKAHRHKLIYKNLYDKECQPKPCYYGFINPGIEAVNKK